MHSGNRRLRIDFPGKHTKGQNNLYIKFKNAIRSINIMAMLVVSRDARMFNVCKSRDVLQTQGLKLNHFSQCGKIFWQPLASGHSLPRLGLQGASARLATSPLYHVLSVPRRILMVFLCSFCLAFLCTGLLNFHTGLISFLSTFPQSFSRTYSLMWNNLSFIALKKLEKVISQPFIMPWNAG